MTVVTAVVLRNNSGRCAGGCLKQEFFHVTMCYAASPYLVDFKVDQGFGEPQVAIQKPLVIQALEL